MIDFEEKFTKLRDHCIKEIQDMAFEEAKTQENPPSYTVYMLQQSHFRLLFIYNLLKAWFDAIPKLEEVIDKEAVEK